MLGTAPVHCRTRSRVFSQACLRYEMAKRPKTPGSGRKKGSKNKAVLEREAVARAALEETRRAEAAEAARERADKTARLMTAGVKAADSAAEIVEANPKLMKDIAFDFARLWAGMAAFHQPYPTWHPAVDGEGKPILDKRGRPIMENDNPNFDEAKFLKYGELATQTALGAAKYQSPSLSAVMVGQQIVNKITITGGLPDSYPDEEIDAAENPGEHPPRLTGPELDGSGNHAADVSPGAASPAQGSDAPEEGGGPVRKAVG